MESRHCGQDKRIFFCPDHNASTPCSLQAFGIRCIVVVVVAVVAEVAVVAVAAAAAVVVVAVVVYVAHKFSKS